MIMITNKQLLNYQNDPETGLRPFATDVVVPNAGGRGTTDMIDTNFDGVLDSWTKYGGTDDSVFTISAGNGFPKNYQQVVKGAGGINTGVRLMNILVVGGRYRLTMYKQHDGALNVYDGTTVIDSVPANTTTTLYTKTFTATNTFLYIYMAGAVAAGSYSRFGTVNLESLPCVANYELSADPNDQSGNGFNATAVSITYPLTGRYANGVAKFNGTNSTLKPPINTTTDILLNNTHTVCGWLRYGTKAIVLIQRASYNEIGVSDGGLIYQISGDNFVIRRAFGSSNVTNSIPLSSNGITNTKWNFYAVMYNKLTGFLSLLINGRLFLYADYTTADVVINPTYDQGYHIGSNIRNAPTGDIYTDGAAGRWKLYNRLLNIEEITQLYYQIP